MSPKDKLNTSKVSPLSGDIRLCPPLIILNAMFIELIKQAGHYPWILDGSLYSKY